MHAVAPLCHLGDQKAQEGVLLSSHGPAGAGEQARGFSGIWGK